MITRRWCLSSAAVLDRFDIHCKHTAWHLHDVEMNDCIFSSRRVMNCCWQMLHVNQVGYTFIVWLQQNDVPWVDQVFRNTLNSVYMRTALHECEYKHDISVQCLGYLKQLPTERTVIWTFVTVHRTSMLLQVDWDAENFTQIHDKVLLKRKHSFTHLQNFEMLLATCNKKAQLSLTNPRDAKACQNCSNSTCLQRCRWQYWPIFMRLTAIASEIGEIPRNSLKIQTYGVQGHPRSLILVSIESPYVTCY